MPHHSLSAHALRCANRLIALCAGDTVTLPRAAGEAVARQAMVLEILPAGAAALDNGQVVAVDTVRRHETGEQWQRVVGYDDRYLISSHGKVVSTAYRQTARVRLLKPQRPQTYPFVMLANSTGKTLFGLNRLVAQHFLAPPLAGQSHVVPKDGNPLNVRADNLAWANRSDVTTDAIADYFFRRGERHPHSRLTADEVAQIRQLAAEGLTKQALADQFGVSRPTISTIVRHLTRRHG